MTAITIAARASDDGTLTIPREVVETLGLRPGEEAELSIESRCGPQTAPVVDYDAVLDKLFDEADKLVPEPCEPVTDPLKAAYGAGVEEKFKKMGITL